MPNPPVVEPDTPRLGAGTTVHLGPPADGWWRGTTNGTPFRAVPLLRVLGAPADLVVVGQVHVTVGTCHVLTDVFVEGLWTAVDGSWAPLPLTEAPDLSQLLTSPSTSLEATSHDPGAEAEGAVANIAKALAEESRGATRRLREQRYALESALAEQLRPGRRGSVLPTLATLLELGVICGRAADHAREAVREGLWLWLTDAEAYQAYRTAQDPTILNGHAPAAHGTRPWMRTHDAAVRQCRAMEEQLTAEAAVIAGLLDAAATIASARETESQQTFNTLVGVAAVGLGLPALVLSLYSADRLVPFTSLRQVLALLPIAVAAGLAGVVAVRGLPAGSTRKHVAGTFLVVLGLMLLLIFAGIVAPAISP